MGDVSKLSSTLSRMALGGNLTSPPNVVFTQEDKKHCGLWDIDQLQEVLYRVCRDDENLDNDIVSKVGPSPPPPSSTPKKEVSKKEVSAKKAVNQHIHSGHIATQFISCTASPDVALKWAFYEKKQKRPQPLRIIKIYIPKIPTKIANQMINLTNEEVRNYFLSGKPQKDWAKGCHEVLFQWKIPKKVPVLKTDGYNSWLVEENLFDLWVNPPMPPPPK